jgi:hemerythrin
MDRKRPARVSATPRTNRSAVEAPGLNGRTAFLKSRYRPASSTVAADDLCPSGDKINFSEWWGGPIVTRNVLHEIPIALDIGIAEIDSQHRQLQTLLERLRQSTDKRYGFAADAILAELLIQTRIHFAVEESLMRLLSFPDTEAHVEEHRTLTEQLEKLRKRVQDFEVADGLTNFIQTWLVDHVNHFDREFVGHFLAKGVDPQVSPVTRKPPA